MCGIKAKIVSHSGSARGLRCSPDTTRTRKMHIESIDDCAGTRIVSRSRNTCHDSAVVHHEYSLHGGVLFGAGCPAIIGAYVAFPRRVAAVAIAERHEKISAAHASFAGV